MIDFKGNQLDVNDKVIFIWKNELHEGVIIDKSATQVEVRPIEEMSSCFDRWYRMTKVFKIS